MAQAAREAGMCRAARDEVVARVLAERATIRPEGYALLSPGPIEAEALAALLRCIAGAAHAPPIDRVALLARAPRPATIGGVRIVSAGRLGAGWLLVREPRAMRAAVPARRDAVWDGRFRLAAWPPDGSGSERLGSELSAETSTPVARLACARGALQPGTWDAQTFATGRLGTLGPLGADAVRFRTRDGPPSVVLHGLPALRTDGMLIAVPHIGVGDPRWRLLFDPRNCAAGAPFLPGAPAKLGNGTLGVG